MFSFIHTFTNASLPGLQKQGLWHAGDGLKIMHKPYFPAERGFNEYAKPGTLLYQTLRELRCPFYIDRMQGGLPFPYWYPFNTGLLEQYKELLGDNFWGFQMHEWASNFRSDMPRITAALKKWREENPGTPEERFWNAAVQSAKTDPMALFTEAFTVAEWSKTEPPQSCSEFIGRLRPLWDMRSRQTGCPLIPADSYYMAPKIEIAGGAKLLLPEIGWQIPGSRFQIAYTRGMAKAAHIRWGVYYECWGGQKDYSITIPYSVNSADNEWQEKDLMKDMERITGGRSEQGGSSRSLQERLWLYAYFAGARVMGEEYGVCNTFRNYQDFELSEYGEVKKRFLDFVQKFPDVGSSYTPVAIALPQELEIYSLNDDGNSYLQFPLFGAKGAGAIDEVLSGKIKKARSVIRALLYNGQADDILPGKDRHCIQNSPYPDIFDVLHGDQTEALSHYEYIIDLTGDEQFAARYKNIIEPQELEGLLPQLLPCTLTGGVHYMFNKTQQGWLLLAINNEGVLRDNFSGDSFCEKARIISRVDMRCAQTALHALAGSGEIFQEDGKYTLSLGAGEWLLIALA